MGTDFALRLEPTNSPGNGSNSGQPSHSVLGRKPFDRRRIEQAAAHKATKLLPARSGTLWDLVALYPQGRNWNESEPFYVDGPVYKVGNELQSQTSKLLQSVNAINVSSAKPIR
jgi:hypothetical protein